MLQVTQEINKQLGVQLHASAAYHTSTDGQSKIDREALKKYVHHFSW